MPRLEIIFAIFAIVALFCVRPIHAESPTGPTSTLQSIQTESHLEWKDLDRETFQASAALAGVGTLSIVSGVLDVNDAVSDNVFTQNQGTAGVGFFMAGALAWSAPILYWAGEDTVKTHRWHKGLRGSALLLGGASLLVRGVEPDLRDGSRSFMAWRDIGMGDVLSGSVILLGGLYEFLDAIWDYSGRWAFLSLGEQLSRSDSFSISDQEDVESTGIALLEQRRQSQIDIQRYAGISFLIAGGSLVVNGFLHSTDSVAKVGAAGGGLGVLLGGVLLVASFQDKPLFPRLDANDIEFLVSSSPYTGEPMFVLAGTF